MSKTRCWICETEMDPEFPQICDECLGKRIHEKWHADPCPTCSMELTEEIYEQLGGEVLENMLDNLQIGFVECPSCGEKIVIEPRTELATYMRQRWGTRIHRQ